MLGAGQVRWSVTGDTARRDAWHRGSEKVPGPAREASSRVLVNNVRAAIGSSVEVEVSLPIAWVEARDALGEESRSGVGDLLTRVHWGRSGPGWRWGVSAGAYWPVGELGDRGLPRTATFSSGTVDPSLGAYVSGHSVGDFRFQVSLATRRVMLERDDGRKLGSSVTAALGVGRPLTRRLTVQANLTYFGREGDEGNAMEDTGGDWLYFQPFLSADVFVRPSYAMQVLVGGRLPLVQNVRGMQLVESASVSLGFAQTVRF